MRRLKVLLIILILIVPAGVFMARYRAETQPVTSNTGSFREAQQTNSTENKDAKAFYDEGVNQYIASIPYDPVNYEQRQREKFEAAAESFKRAISLKPDYPEAYQYLGNSYDALHRYDLAVEAYEQATRLKPDWWEPYNGTGQAQAALHRYDEAIRAYRKALDLYSRAFDEPHPGIIESLAIAYLNSGDRTAALTQYKVLKKVCEKADCGDMVKELQYLLKGHD